MKITTYNELIKVAHAFGDGRLPLLFLVGRPGTGKSRAVRDALPKARYLRGVVSAFALHRDLWRHLDAPYILDDVDTYRDRSILETLKALCEREKNKRVCWLTGRLESADGDKEHPPQEFTTNSRVVLISNDRAVLDTKIGAIEDRGLVVEFTPTPGEIHCRATGFCQDREVLEFIGQKLTLTGGRLTLRQYQKAQDLKQADLDWRGMLLDVWQLPAAQALVVSLLDEADLRMEERASRFAAAGHSARNFYYIYERLREAGAVSKPKRSKTNGLQFCSKPYRKTKWTNNAERTRWESREDSHA